jgi:hypothetical protein
MIYFIEFLKGIILSAGVLFGFIFFAVYLVKRIGKAERTYYADDLLIPFKDYLTKIETAELYDQITEVKDIITQLEAGTVPDLIKSYIIKKDVSIQTADENGSPSIKPITKYIILNKKIKNG